MKKIIFLFGLLSTISIGVSAQTTLVDIKVNYEVEREYRRLIGHAMEDGREIVQSQGWGLTVEDAKKMQSLTSFYSLD